MSPAPAWRGWRPWFRDYRWGLAQASGATPRWSAAWAAALFLSGTLPVPLLAAGRVLLHALERGEQDRIAYGLAAVVAGISAIFVLGAVLQYSRGRIADAVQQRLTQLLLRHASHLPAAFFDDPQGQDQLHRARADAMAQPLVLFESTGRLVQSGLIFLGVVVFLSVFYTPWFAALLLLGTVPALLLWARHALAAHRRRHASTLLQRIAGYLMWTLTDRTAAAEVRTLGLGPPFSERHAALQDNLTAQQRRIERSEFLTALASGGITLLSFGGAIALLLHQHTAGRVMLGDLVVAFYALLMAQRLMQTLLEGGGRLYRAGLYLSDLRAFLTRPAAARPPRPVPPPAPLRQGVRFERVSFTYSGADTPVLHNFSIEFPANQITAIVGPSGSGKSTVLRLLCGLYGPQQGCIAVDGVPLTALDPDEWQRQLGVLFQEPMRFPATFAENISYGNGHPHESLTAAWNAAGAADIVAQLPKGADTMLGKVFGGVDLSGGQWQRVALARAYARNSHVLLLDEPTSGLDPWSESQWFENLRAQARNRTVILVTHRFTTAMRTDLIHVLDRAQLAESGTHDQLLARQGLYAAGWRAQMNAG